ncbi:MAG TPA: hypothetical protein VN611_13615 [Patescibacteria group bacterium]|nr:hypothetical protein [Patescibacteria group bacterium]
MPTIGEKNTASGIYKCSRCGNEKQVNQQDSFPACKSCDIPGMKWVVVRSAPVLPVIIHPTTTSITSI